MGLAFAIQSLAATLFGVVAVAGFAALLFSPFAALPGLILAALPALVGWVAFLVLRRFTTVRAWMAVLSGFLIGAVPAFVFGFSPSAADFASANGVQTVIEGRRTLWGWLELAKFAASVGVLGASGGLVFWLIVRRAPVSRGGMRRAGLWLVAAVACTVVMASLPLIAKDRSCHNITRDGQSVVSPRFSAVLAIGPDDWQDLEGVLQAFAAEEQWSLRPQIDPPGTPSRQFRATVCAEPGTMILLVQHLLPPDVAKRLGDPGGLSITVYQPKGVEGWQGPTARLLGRLAERWPGSLSFRGEGGRPAPPPDWLRPALPRNGADEVGS